MSPVINAPATTPPAPRQPADGLDRVTVDPATLVVDANVRRDVQLDAEFIASIGEHGVLTPITARRDPLGQLLVVDGQRRTLAAIEAELPQVPVDVVDGIGDDESRITTQYVVNEHRRGLTAADKIASVHQLSLFGRSPAAITKRLRIPRADVDAALAVSQSKATTSALAEHPEVDLVAAAVIAEFDDDPEAVAELVEVAETEPRRLEHVASTLRSQREERDLVARVRAELEATGITVLDEAPVWDDKSSERLHSLTDDPGAKGYPPPLDPVEHEACPGHAVWVTARRAWDNGKVDGWRAELLEYCMDWRGNGHHKRSASNTAGATSGPQSDEQKAERRALIANNKAADAAVPVRHAWLTEFVQRTKLPSGTSTYVARILTNGAAYPDGDAHRFASDLLWPTASAAMAAQDVHAKLARPATADAYLVALAAAVVETHMPRDYHRSGGEYRSNLIAMHLRQLEAWGYVLADVEATWLAGLIEKEA